MSRRSVTPTYAEFDWKGDMVAGCPLNGRMFLKSGVTLACVSMSKMLLFGVATVAALVIIKVVLLHRAAMDLEALKLVETTLEMSSLQTKGMILGRLWRWHRVQ